jgi:Fur family transcriptional regulator, ferric uptake regulator
MTVQQRALNEVLEESTDFASAQELHARLIARGHRVGLATVYAQLRRGADAGELDSMRADTGEVRFRRCGQRSHHHHLICRTCGHAVELDAPEIEAWTKGFESRYGFTEIDHIVEVTGLCANCATE